MVSPVLRKFSPYVAAKYISPPDNYILDTLCPLKWCSPSILPLSISAIASGSMSNNGASAVSVDAQQRGNKCSTSNMLQVPLGTLPVTGMPIQGGSVSLVFVGLIHFRSVSVTVNLMLTISLHRIPLVPTLLCFASTFPCSIPAGLHPPCSSKRCSRTPSSPNPRLLMYPPRTLDLYVQISHRRRPELEC